jgi:hypothetical protein
MGEGGRVGTQGKKERHDRGKRRGEVSKMKGDIKKEKAWSKNYYCVKLAKKEETVKRLKINAVELGGNRIDRSEYSLKMKFLFPLVC